METQSPQEPDLNEATEALVTGILSAEEWFRILRELAQTHPGFLRSVSWKDAEGRTCTVPVALRQIRRDLEFLDAFYSGRRPV